MAFGDGTDPTLTELIARYWVPTVFSKNVITHTQSKLVVANSVNTEYRSELRYGATVDIPVTTEPTAAAVVAGTAITVSDVSTTGNTLTVNKWYGTAIEISEVAQVQDWVGYLEKSAISCSYSVAKRVDTDLGALFSSLGGYSTSAYGSDGQELTDDIILVLMQTLDQNDVPEDDRSIICDPSSKSDLLKIDKFVRNDYVRNPVVPTGQFGAVYNMAVKITNNLTAVSSGTGNYGCMLHRDALGLVMQKDPYSQMIPQPLTHRTVFQVKVLYGVGELRDTFGIPFFTRKS
jgi:hypothetical protein